MFSINTNYINEEVLDSILSAYKFTAQKYIEDDNSVTLSLNEIDLAENGTDEYEAKIKLAKAIIEYSEDYYKDFDYWSSALNRKSHIPYVFKSLLVGDYNKLGEMIECRLGKI